MKPHEKYNKIIKRENEIFFPDGHFEYPTEFDTELNFIQREKIKAFKEIHGDCWLGSINRYSNEIFKPYLEQISNCYNFERDFTIPKYDLLSVFSKGFQNCFDLIRNHGIDVKFGGGETADMPDQILTLDISGTAIGRVKLSKVVSGEKVKPGDVIIGLRSGGKCAYEEKLNSGIMCNGITLARHVLMSQKYSERYPELTGYGSQVYSGNYLFDDHIENLEMTVGEAIISPTRIYTPIIIEVLKKLGSQVTGLVHNTGGGMTKCLRIGSEIHYHKFDLPQPDPIFKIIKMASGEGWETMYKSFNMGVGFEIVVKQEVADEVMSISERYKVEAKIIGRCEKAKENKRNTLLIESPWGTFNYT